MVTALAFTYTPEVNAEDIPEPREVFAKLRHGVSIFVFGKTGGEDDESAAVFVSWIKISYDIQAIPGFKPSLLDLALGFHLCSSNGT
jgi:hypothetical protein